MIDQRLIERLAVSYEVKIPDIQRWLGISFGEAAMIIDDLYNKGIVGEPRGSRGRLINHEKLSEYLP